MSKRILIVDDEPDLVKVLRMRLIENKFEVDTAMSGQEVFEKLSQQTPDLIILDIMMPHMSGAEVASKLKQNPNTSRIPIIFVSALHTKQEEKDKGNLIGENVIFAKPYDMKALLPKIHEMLGS